MSASKSDFAYRYAKRRIFNEFRKTLDADCPDEEKKKKLLRLHKALNIYAKQYGPNVAAVEQWRQDFAPELRAVGIGRR